MISSMEFSTFFFFHQFPGRGDDRASGYKALTGIFIRIMDFSAALVCVW